MSDHSIQVYLHKLTCRDTESINPSDRFALTEALTTDQQSLAAGADLPGGPVVPLIPRLNIHVEAGVGIPTLFFPDDRSFQGIWSHPDVPDIVFSDSSISGPAVFRGGAIGTGAPVQLVYWGSFWKTTEGRAREQFLTDGMRRMIDSVYLVGTRAVRHQSADLPGLDDRHTARSTMRFKDGTMKPVLDLVDDLIGDERVPDPDDERIAFIVFMPRYFANPPSGDLGAHSSDLKYDFPFDTDRYWAAWVGYYAFDLDGTPRDRDPEDTLMIASHELVGILTSPEQDGWTIGPKEEHIPDAAILLPGGVEQVANVNGVRVNAYWSNAHNATIIPIDRDYAGQLVGRLSPPTSTCTRPGHSGRTGPIDCATATRRAASRIATTRGP